MKKIILCILAMLLMGATALAGETPIVGFVTGSGGLGDLSYNDMAYGGIRKAQQDFKFKLIVLEPNASGETTEADIIDLVNKSDIILLIGAQHVELAKNSAKKHPGKIFVLAEVPIENIPNMSSMMFNQNEGSFLAGALAGYMTKSGMVGFVGGTKILPVEAFEQGYREGVAYANPDVKVLVDYAAPAGDFSGFQNPRKGHQLAMAQYTKGADIVFAVAGLTGNGVIEAARKTKQYAIGVDSDQDSLAKGFVLTSMIKRMDMAMYGELQRILKGEFAPGPIYYGLANKGVSLSEMKYTRDAVPDNVMKKLEEIKNKIISGELRVTNLLSQE